MKRDYTLEAVTRQLHAMACPAYDITLKNSVTGASSMHRAITMGKVLALLPTLKHMNSKPEPEHIYVRPAPALNRALVLVDDIDDAAVDHLRRVGLEPCCVVETHKGCLQCWVDFGPEPMPEDDRAVLSRYLRDFTNGDKGSVASLHNGRLAGFTNRKEAYFGLGGEGLHPYVLCWRDSRPLVCTKAAGARVWAHKQVEQKAQAARQRACNGENTPLVIRAASSSAGGNRYSSDPNTVTPRYLEVALEKALGRIRGASEGSRHHAVYAAAFSLGTIAHIFAQADVSADSLKNALVQESMSVYGNAEVRRDNVWREKEAVDTVRVGFEKGKENSDLTHLHLQQPRNPQKNINDIDNPSPRM